MLTHQYMPKRRGIQIPILYHPLQPQKQDYFLGLFTSLFFLATPRPLEPDFSAFRSGSPSCDGRVPLTPVFAGLTFNGLLILPSCLVSSSDAANSLSGDVFFGS
jgi:hypothetical protein